MIETSTLSFAVGNLVKNDFSLQGNGKMDMFDGLIPCDTAIASITVTGQTAGDGIVHISYTYTGVIYQVKWRIDNTGDYAFALADLTIDVPGLALGSHSVEIIPVCLNNFEGTGSVQDFVVTQSLTCGSVITAITVTTGAGANATNTHTGAATQMKYRIDGGVWINALIDAVISLTGLPVGNHAIEEVPICSNNIEGTGTSQAFTVASNPSQSVINYVFNKTASNVNCIFQIWVNGVLTINKIGSASGSLVVPIGATVKAQMSANSTAFTSVTSELEVVDTTTSAVLVDLIHSAVSWTQNFTFTPMGDEFTITESVS